MGQKPETLFKKRVQKDLEAVHKLTAALWWVKTQQVCIVGTPDVLLCVAGKFVAIELKARAQDRPSRKQWDNLNKINQGGGLGICAHPGNWPDLLYVVSLIASGRHVSESTLAAARTSIGINYGARPT